MPTQDDKVYARRLSFVLRELRAAAGWSQEKAAEQVGVSLSTYQRWESGSHAPKGYDMGRAYKAYRPFGAEQDWFFDPPEVVITMVNPVRDRLAERAALAGEAEASAREDLAAEQERHRVAAARRAEKRRTRPA